MENNNQGETIGEHNCKDYEIWSNQSDCNFIYCDKCNKISHFRWKSTWKHLRFLFWDRVKSNK